MSASAARLAVPIYIRAVLGTYSEVGRLPVLPCVGSAVHYVPPDGRSCMAAVVTAVSAGPLSALTVFWPPGADVEPPSALEAVPFDSGVFHTIMPGAAETASGIAVLCGAASYPGGSWHFPAGS
jgi:hypothetical protein